jgi:uncharacterized flavoprotein (TIGR03862 family)
MGSMVKNKISVIGAGPAGLMAAEVLSAQHLDVHVYDSMPSAGRKLLMAGKSGLNITHSEPFEKFVQRYGARQHLVEPMLKEFGPEDIRRWAGELGVETFVGTSGRVFPVGMKASPLLRTWLKRLEKNGVSFHLRHRWVGWDEDKRLLFDSPEGKTRVESQCTILALGGGSWRRLGSDGAWTQWLEQAGVKIEAFSPSNCGFDVNWSDHFREKYHGHPVKSTAFSFNGVSQLGEFVITRHGVEGSLVYAFSAGLRDALKEHGAASFQLDLCPQLSYEDVLKKLSRPRGSHSLASHFEKTLGIKGVKAGLLREFVSKQDIESMEKVAGALKSLSVPVVSTRPLDEAISSAGGVRFEELDEHLMLKKMPGVFCAGEMLDWEAPTGGYLLTACLASGYKAGQAAAEYTKNSGV